MPITNYRRSLAAAACFVGTFGGGEAMAAGSLAAKCETLPKLVFGTDETGYKVSKASYDLETGKCYELEISSTGNKEYAIRGAEFFRNIWLRKIEVGEVEIKAHSLYELEFEKEGAAEIFFVPIQKGSYSLTAEGLAERGTGTKFNVK
ncbi:MULTISPECIES: copper-binding protein [Rhodomicrobium]|uniref:copper-binding protein n=1 Tax=Rhodomicrobium TaxID=1068 RepID=UPI000F73DC35|nr:MULTISPECIES: copper-binding protein [Rhodomicrobium]